jgi:hypothetical protein
MCAAELSEALDAGRVFEGTLAGVSASVLEGKLFGGVEIAGTESS